MVSLRPYTDADIWLTELLEQNSVVMEHLGGVARAERVRSVHAKRMAGLAEGDWYYVVHADGVDEPVGLIAIWRSTVDGRQFDEIGLMMRPEHHRRGVGFVAMRMLLDRARDERPDKRVESYTSVTNDAANGGARALGYRLAGERDLDYEGEPLRMYHWVLDL